jgi:hypothetical protein
MRRRDFILTSAGVAVGLVACGGGDSQSAAPSQPAPPSQPSSPSQPTPVKEYSTNFQGTEDPLSEDGNWSNNGLDWTAVQKLGGAAQGTLTGTVGYDDSYARLSGFTAYQSASAVIHLNPGIDSSCTHEVEILLRCTDAPHSVKCYECNLSFDGKYCEIVRWNGAVGDFTYLARGAPGAAPRNGDTFKAVVQDDLIIVYLNDVEVIRATDTSYPTGNPGIGFYRGAPCGSNSDYGFSSFSAQSF